MYLTNLFFLSSFPFSGGKYDASIADLPVSSLQIVNMETQELKCQVPLPGKPDRVVYVPPQPGQGSFDGVESLSNEIVVVIVLASLFGLGVIGWMVIRCRSSRDMRNHNSKEDGEEELAEEAEEGFVGEMTAA